MTNEEMIREQLIARFPDCEGKVRIQRERRIWTEVPLTHFIYILQFAKEDLKFVEFCTMTGLDEGENLAFIYHVAQERTGIILNIKIATPKANPVIPTITHLFPSAELPEREVEDLLGAIVSGLPPGHRYPLPDDWPQGDHPLRKDWKQPSEAAKAEVSNG
ncbi:MAG TPA: NADH-quinone oxidoreductase subunit C [Terriglobales bacterium]